MTHTMRNTLITASLLAALSGAALAQTGPGPGAAAGPMAGASGPKAGMHEHMREHMHEHMASRHAKHLSELKGKLKLDAQQETAWKTFADAMQPPAAGAGRPDRAAMAKLSTPERVDQMQAFHARMEGEMKKRGDAAKTFYAGLNPEQKKVFDAETARFMSGKGGRHMEPMH